MELYLLKNDNTEIRIKKTGRINKTNKFTNQFIFVDKPVDYDEFFNWFQKQFSYIEDLTISGIFKNQIIVKLKKTGFIKKHTPKTEITISDELLKDKNFSIRLNTVLEKFKKYKEEKTLNEKIRQFLKLTEKKNIEDFTIEDINNLNIQVSSIIEIIKKYKKDPKITTSQFGFITPKGIESPSFKDIFNAIMLLAPIFIYIKFCMIFNLTSSTIAQIPILFIIIFGCHEGIKQLDSKNIKNYDYIMGKLSEKLEQLKPLNIKELDTLKTEIDLTKDNKNDSSYLSIKEKIDKCLDYAKSHSSNRNNILKYILTLIDLNIHSLNIEVFVYIAAYFGVEDTMHDELIKFSEQLDLNLNISHQEIIENFITAIENHIMINNNQVEEAKEFTNTPI